MATIDKAMLTAKQGGDWTVKAKLLTRQIFTKRKEGATLKLLIEVFVDQDGQVMEVKSWSERKIYTVYRRFAPGSCVEICSNGQVRDPNRRYSQAKCEIYSRWFLNQVDDFKFKNSIHCFASISKFQRSSKKPASVVGLFSSLAKGPVRKTANNFILAQGYYVRLLDDQSRLFQVLVWSNPVVEKGQFALEGCEQNDLILILYAREQDERYSAKTTGYYTLTSTYPPLVNPDCVSLKVYNSLRMTRQSFDSERCVLYEPSNQ